jgi:hypothetical protein
VCVCVCVCVCLGRFIGASNYKHILLLVFLFCFEKVSDSNFGWRPIVLTKNFRSYTKKIIQYSPW